MLQDIYILKRGRVFLPIAFHYLKNFYIKYIKVFHDPKIVLAKANLYRKINIWLFALMNVQLKYAAIADHIGGRSLTKLTKFCPLLITYLPTVDIAEGIS